MANIKNMAPRSGRIIGENGETRNIVDLLGGGANAVGTADINNYAPRSGRIIGEDGNIYNEVDLIGGIRQELKNVYPKDEVYNKTESDERFEPIGTAEELVEAAAPVMVWVGDPVVMENAAAAPLIAAKIDILPIQAGSGVPSPTNIRALSAHESVTLKHSVSGKSVYDSYEAEFDTPVWAGGFDFVSGELVSGCAAVDMGDLIIYPVSGQSHVFALKLPDNVKDISGFSINSTWCSMYDGYSSESMSDLGNYRYTMFKAAEDIGVGFAAGDIGILVRDDRFDFVPDFSVAVNGQTFVYPLATLLVENVAVGPINMHEGTNTLWCDDAGGELGRNVEAEWYVNNAAGNAMGRLDGKFEKIWSYLLSGE